MRKKKILPVGSIVQTKKPKKTFVIAGIMQHNGGAKGDYIVESYPPEAVNQQYTRIISHKDIKKVVSWGNNVAIPAAKAKSAEKRDALKIWKQAGIVVAMFFIIAVIVLLLLHSCDKWKNSEETPTTAPSTNSSEDPATTNTPEELWSEWSEWSTIPVYESETRLVESKIQYSYRAVYHTTESLGWSSWSDWQDTAIEVSDQTKVETQTVYPYYYFYCTNCRNNGVESRWPYWSVNCGQCGTYIDISHSSIEWFTTPWSYSAQWNSEKYHQYFDGEIYWNWTEGQPKTQYRYCTLLTTEKTTYGQWSAWGDEPVPANAEREVQTQWVYRYKDRMQ